MYILLTDHILLSTNIGPDNNQEKIAVPDHFQAPMENLIVFLYNHYMHESCTYPVNITFTSPACILIALVFIFGAYYCVTLIFIIDVYHNNGGIDPTDTKKI